MNALTGTRMLIRLILRRDRMILPIWISIVALVPISMAASFADTIPNGSGAPGICR
jgi:ABC-2 type transport system permease protein